MQKVCLSDNSDEMPKTCFPLKNKKIKTSGPAMSQNAHLSYM